MTLSYYDHYDEVEIEGESCPNCKGDSTMYDRTFGFWKCEDCSTVWGHDQDDPDYDEGEPCSACKDKGSFWVPAYSEYVKCDVCNGSGVSMEGDYAA